MTRDFTGRVAVITGGTSGIGFAAAHAMVRAGGTVIIAGRNGPRGDEAAAAIGAGTGRAVFVKSDMRRSADVDRLFRQASALHGRIDYLFNNAGVEGEDDDEAALDELLDTNIKGVLVCLRHALERFTAQRSGVIVNTASFVGTTLPLPRAIAYGSTKAAVVSITHSVAASLTAQGVSVFAVCPWITDTPMLDRLAKHDPVVKARIAALNPSGRMVHPGEVAAVVLAMFAGALGLESGEAVLVDSGGVLQTIAPMRPGPVLRFGGTGALAAR
jgi:NAD(P)-dependent dehydrogenase (short-subunit alcohol dehydrogenase family)